MRKLQHSFHPPDFSIEESYHDLYGTPALKKRRRAVWLRYYRDGMEQPVYADLKARALRAGASASRDLREGGEQA